MFIIPFLLINRTGGGTPAAPVNSVAPVISGTPTQGETLSASPGVWTGFPYPSFTYQWEADGSPIVGATSSTFVLTATEVGANITCDVTGTNTEGAATGTSNTIGPVVAAATTIGQPVGLLLILTKAA